MEETAQSILAKLLWICGSTTKGEALATTYALLTVLDEEGWVLIQKEKEHGS